ncbi:hypothetical protein PAEPH01_1633 [Pancytospora epiphaga]|nr:hypothetical protein PAEPH01_1633 [Pancytospora epiphaga]
MPLKLRNYMLWLLSSIYIALLTAELTDNGIKCDNDKAALESTTPTTPSPVEKDEVVEIPMVLETPIPTSNPKMCGENGNTVVLVDSAKPVTDNEESKKVTTENAPTTLQGGNSDRCYVITSNELPGSSNILKQSNLLPFSVKYSYTKYISGVTICTSDFSLIRNIKNNYTSLDIEEDKPFKITSVNNDKKLSKSSKWNNNKNSRDEGNNKKEGDENDISNYQRQGDPATHIHQEYYVPMHFYRIYNMGNLIFNNYLLNNFIFRWLRINYLIKYFYSYSYIYSGSNIKITKIDVSDKSNCNSHSAGMANLLVGTYNSFAKSASLVNLGDVDCNGVIWLSKLLHTLETVGDADILVLPLSGPPSNALDLVVKKMSQRMHVVAAAGNEGGDSCHYSPSGNDIIKAGSVSQNGVPSSFGNRGNCNLIYALGENIMGDSGTSYSAALVASAIAVYLSKHPGAGKHEVIQFLNNNSMASYLKLRILKIPPSDMNETGSKTYVMYHPILVLIAMMALVLVIMLIIFYVISLF